MRKRIVNIDVQRRIIDDYKNRPIPFSDIAFLKPLAYWYEFMSTEQRNDLPPRVSNALDSIHMILKGRM